LTYIIIEGGTSSGREEGVDGKMEEGGQRVRGGGGRAGIKDGENMPTYQGLSTLFALLMQDF
jgi:hypothetical protein